MGKLKVMTIVGTRPEIIRLSSCIKAFDRYFDHILVHTGQNWDYFLKEIFFEELDIREPNYYLDSGGKNLGDSMGNIIAKSYEVLSKERPDSVLLLGDTNSSLAAISAKRLKIPIFHMEAGNRCWDWNVSEMINRKIVDHISDINLPYTEHARRYLLSEGIDGKTIFVTGSPMGEVLREQREKINACEVLKKYHLTKGNYFLLSAHREENIDQEENFISLMESVNHIAGKYEIPVVYSMHPRSRKFVEQRNFVFHPMVQIVEPFGFLEYIKLQINSYCVLSDSGTLSEESALLGFAGVLIRTSTERPEVLDKGSMVIGGIKAETIEQAIEMAVSMMGNREEVEVANDYKDNNVSIKVTKIIQSYADIVNKTIWRKS